MPSSGSFKPSRDQVEEGQTAADVFGCREGYGRRDLAARLMLAVLGLVQLGRRPTARIPIVDLDRVLSVSWPTSSRSDFPGLTARAQPGSARWVVTYVEQRLAKRVAHRLTGRNQVENA